MSDHNTQLVVLLMSYMRPANVQALDLHGNQLTGDMSVVGNMPYLARLSLAGNQLTGTIPAQMASNVLQVWSTFYPHL